MLSVEFIGNMVIGVSIVVGALMIVLVYQIYKTDTYRSRDKK
jgi:chromate transport protein ChrA